MLLAGTLMMVLAANPAVTFEANRGQSDREVRFIARGGDYALFLTGNTARLVMTQDGRDPAQLSLVFEGALITRLKGLADPGVHGIARVMGDQLYPGIDVEYSASQAGALEFLLRVHAGARPGRVALRFDGASALTVDQRGTLFALLGDGQQVRIAAPQAYQLSGERKSRVEVRFVVDAGNLVRLSLGRYDHSRPVVIHSR
jgi:hypothetical protein